jgi:tetratricopeptide (TPR) repeat protein/serine phosphatase RsbU (regulator of sigma subunit)
LDGQAGYAADTLRVLTLYKLVEKFSATAADSAQLWLSRLAAQTQISAYPLARGLFLLGRAQLYDKLGQYDSLIVCAQQATAAFEKANRLDWYAVSCHLTGLGYHQKGEIDSAIAFYQRALELCESQRDTAKLTASYNNLGAAYRDQSRYAEAIAYIHKAIQVGEAARDSVKLAGAHNNLGALYRDQGRIPEALQHFLKAAQIREAIGDKRGLASSYSNLGALYSSLKRYTEALEALQKAAQIRETIGDQRGLAFTYTNMGSLYQDLQQYAEALSYYRRALSIREGIGDKSRIANTLNAISSVYETQGAYDAALKHARRALYLSQAADDQSEYAKSLLNLGSIYQRSGDPATALAYYQQALPLIQNLQAWDLLSYAHQRMSETHAEMGLRGHPLHWPQALQHLHLHLAYKDSILNEDNIRKLERLQNQYAYEKREAFLKAQQEKERLLAHIQIRERETQRNLSLVSLGLAVLIIGALGYFLRIIRRQRSELQRINAEIEVANGELKAINDALDATNQALTTANQNLQSANETLEASNRIIQAQADALAQKNEEILDSIRYAQRIQSVILPPYERWHRLLPENFILYLPRDIVAGDFYWLEETRDYVFVAVADATGHGVPGAFVSLLCVNALYKAIVEENLTQPGAILYRAREIITSQLTQDQKHLRDGMDVALLRLRKDDPTQIAFAGANRPLWLISHQREFIEISSTRQPVGYTDHPKPFEEVELNLHERRPLMLYLFTDGIVDQMGGPQGRKLLPKRLREYLLEIVSLPCIDQEAMLQNFIQNWQGTHPQLDDITCIGLRLS